MPLPMSELLTVVRQGNTDCGGSKVAMLSLLEHAHSQIDQALAEGGVGVDFPCPLCGSQLTLITSEEFYGRDYSRDGKGGIHRWVCRMWPECDAHVGCHGKTYVPLGTPAGFGLRVLRQRCHGAFDRLWKSGIFKRNDAYKWLAKALGIPAKDCHIATFDEGLCKATLNVLNEFWGDGRHGLSHLGEEKLVYGEESYVR